MEWAGGVQLRLADSVYLPVSDLAEERCPANDSVIRGVGGECSNRVSPMVALLMPGASCCNQKQAESLDEACYMRRIAHGYMRSRRETFNVDMEVIHVAQPS